MGAGNRQRVLPGGEEGASGPPAILWDLSDARTVCSCSLRKDGRSLQTFGVSYWDPLVVLATSLSLQSPCPLHPPCSGPRCPMGSLSISTSLIGTSGHSCREFIPTLLPHCFSAKLKKGILKVRAIEIFTLGSRKPETCPTRLCKTRRQAYLPVSSIPSGVPTTEEVFETHTFPPPRTKEASSSVYAEQDRGPVMKRHSLRWPGLPLGA